MRSFRARLPRNFTEEEARKINVSCEASSNFTEEASKMIVSCEASENFHRKSFQNDRFVRCFLEISQNKLPKRLFRARFPPIFTEQASKTNVSRDASFKFPRTKLPNRTFRAMLPTISIENLRFATVSCHRPTESYERVHPAKAKMCVSLQRRAIPHFKIHVLHSGVRKNV